MAGSAASTQAASAAVGAPAVIHWRRGIRRRPVERVARRRRGQRAAVVPEVLPGAVPVLRQQDRRPRRAGPADLPGDRQGRDQFAGRSSFRTYLYTVARHELYHHLRGLQRARNFDPALSSIADLATGAGRKLARNQQHELLCAALRTLPVEQQTLLELHYWDGLDAAALAEVFESNAAAIRNRLHRAREKLREAMLATEGIPPDTVATVEAVDAFALSLR
jgi:RNA polymerase sigma factor (sigma-70 family)